MNWAAIIWLILMVMFLMLEASTVTMVSLWFAAGALAALIASVLGAGTGLQVGIFLAVSCVALAALRPLVRKHFTPKITKTNVDSVVEQMGLVTVTIDNLTAQGQVKVNGMEWSARSASGDPIPAGTRVLVERIEGVKLYVYPAEVKV